MVSIGVIGAGKWGQNHLKTLARLDCKLVGFADPGGEARELAAKTGLRYFKEYRELLPLVDAVTIAAPTNLHYKIAADCLNAGKHVLVEKPIAETVEQGRKLKALAKKKKLVLAVGNLFRFNPALIELKRLLSDSGKIHYLSARYIHSTNPPRTDSGALLNFGPHVFDWLNYLTEKKPKKIFAVKHNFFSREREDAALCSLDYGQFFASAEMSWLHPLKKRDIWVLAEHRKIYADLLEQRIEIHPITVSPQGNKTNPKTEWSITRREPLLDEIKAFFSCIESGEIPVNGADSGIEALELCLSCMKSAEKSAVIK